MQLKLLIAKNIFVCYKYTILIGQLKFLISTCIFCNVYISYRSKNKCRY